MLIMVTRYLLRYCIDQTSVCSLPQRQERFSDCSALLELERKVNDATRSCRGFSCFTVVCSSSSLRTKRSAFQSNNSWSLHLFDVRIGGCWSGEWQSWRRNWRWEDAIKKKKRNIYTERETERWTRVKQRSTTHMTSDITTVTNSNSTNSFKLNCLICHWWWFSNYGTRNTYSTWPPLLVHRDFISVVFIGGW